MSSLVFLEGVLRDHRDRPIMEGIWLVRDLAEQHRILVASDRDREYIEHVLRYEGLTQDVVDIYDNTLELPPVPLWQRQIEVARNRGPVPYLLTADPERVAWAVERGVISLLFAHPRQASVARRPDIANRSWEQLVDELDVRP